MKTLVRDIITKSVDWVNSGLTLQKVVTKMAENDAHHMVLIENEEVVGIITERDVLRLYHDQVDFQRPVLDFATLSVISMSHKRPLGYALSLMIDHGIRRIVAVDENQKYFGSVSQEELIFAYEQELFKGHSKVNEIIDVKNKVISISSDSTLADALDVMTKKNIGSILIFENSVAVGILTESDTLRLAQKHIATDKSVKEFMHSPVLEIEWDAYVFEVIEFMRKKRIRHVLTHNDRNEYYVMSSKDVLKTIKGNYSSFLELKLKDVRDTFNQMSEVVIELVDLGDDQVVSWLNASAKNLFRVKVDSSIEELIPKDRWNAIYKEIQQNVKASAQTISIENRDFRFSVSLSTVIGIDVIKILMTDVTELTDRNKELSYEIGEVKKVAIDKEKLFRETFNQAAVGIFHVSRENKIINLNVHASKLLGYSVDELIGKDVYDVTAPEDREITRKSYKKLWIDKTVDDFSIDKRCTKKDGSRIWINVTTSLSLDEEDEKQYSICVLIDITERKAYERELTIAEEKYEKIVQLSPEVIAVSRLSDGTVLEINDQGVKQTGYSREELIGNNRVNDIWMDKNERESFLRVLRSKRKISKFVHEFKTNSGEIRVGEVSATVVELDNKECYITIYRDITEQQRLLDDLRQSNKLFEAVYNQAAMGIAITSTQSNFLQTNQKFCDLLGYTENELKKLNIFDVTNKKDLQKSSSLMKDVSASKKTNFSVEKRYVKKDGTVFWGNVTVSRVLDAEGNLKFNIAILEDIQKRKDAQEHVEELAHLMDLNVNEIYIMDRESFKVNYANKNALVSTGYSLEELKTMTPFDFVLKPESELAEFFRKLVKHEIDIIPFIQAYHKRKDGTTYPIQAQLQLVEYEGKEHILGVVVNSTVEMQAQKDAAFQYNTLRSVLDSTDDVIYYKDYLHSDGNYIGINKSMARLLNKPESSIIGHNDIEIFGEEFAKKYRRDDKMVIKNKSSKTAEEWVTDSHNNRVLFSTQKTPFYNESNELVGVLGIGRDVTKIHNQQIEILEQKENLENAQRIAHIGSWDLNLISGELNWSDEVYKIFDIDKENNTPSYELLIEKTHPNDREYVDLAYNLSIEQKTLYDVTHRILTDKEEIRYVHERAEHKYDNNGVIMASVGTVQDVTQVVRYEEELRQSEELMMAQSRHAAMGEMIGMIAHQWRQPISVISMSANNMLLDISLEEINVDEFEKGASSILNQTQHLSKTIDDFRNFFRPDTEKETVTLKSIVDESVGIFGASLKSSNIALHTEIHSDALMRIHGRELLQVYINLIKNAKDSLIENREDNRIITIIVTENDTHVNTMICDNGGGIPTDNINKIFDPYFTTKDKINGTGIGLHMSKTIIEKHMDGTLTVQNTDEGACFTVQLPKQKDN